MIARSWSNGSATRSATGGCASSRRSARRCMPRGRWPSSVSLIERFDMPIETMWSDDGIVLRLPEAADSVPISRADHRSRRHRRTGGRRVCRRRRCSRRASASARHAPCCCHDDDPIGARHCGNSVNAPPICCRWRRSTRRSRSCSKRRASACKMCSTCPACARCSANCAAGQCVSSASTPSKASPFAQSLLFNWIAAYMYEGDAPLAERRAAALSLDRDLLRDLLGAEELRELLDADVLADVELELQCVADGRRARSADELHDVFRKVGDLTAPRSICGARVWPASGSTSSSRTPTRRSRSNSAASRGYLAAEDAAQVSRRLRVQRPAGVAAGVHRAGGPSTRVARRSLRAHPRPVHCHRCRASDSLLRSSGSSARSPGSEADDRVVHGEFRPGGVGREYCDADVLRQLRQAFAGDAAARGRAGRARGLCPLHPGMARHPRRASRPRLVGRGVGPTAGCGAGCLHVGDRGAAGAAAQLPGRRSRRAVHHGRRRLGRQRWHRAERRPDPLVLRRPVRHARRVARSSRPAGRRVARCHPLAPCIARRQLLEPVARRVRRRHGCRDAGCAVGSGVGRRGQQRLARAAARSVEWRQGLSFCGCTSRSASAGPADPNRSAGGCRSLVVGRPATHHGAVAHPGGTRRCHATARALWRRHPRGRDGRGRQRWVRRDLCRAEGVGGARPGPPRLLRGRARCRAVRPARRGRPVAICSRGGRRPTCIPS